MTDENAFVLKWKNKIYYVPEEVWNLKAIPDALEGEVLDLIKTGAVLTSDPGRKPLMCVVNLDTVSLMENYDDNAEI